MPKPYLLKNIQGITNHSGSKKTGHVVHCLNYRKDNGKTIPVFYKENKRGNPDASIKEIAFSELARLFMLPHSTPKYHLVHDSEHNTVSGIASHNIQLSIAKKTNIQTLQFKKILFSPQKNKYYFEDVTVKKTSDIRYQFLNQLPHGFFAYLMDEKNKGTLGIDMDSLANTLVGKYTLEEDDLHKANVGFYTVVKENKCHIVFFNIDHDLMLNDSIMSFLNVRIANLAYGDKAFNITPEDLLNFPDLQTSENHYWPTHKRFMIKYGDDKAYTLSEERAAFRNLKHDPEFNRYKWKRFLKCILISDDLMHSSLSLHFNPNLPQDASEINLVTQAMNERIIKLRAVLFSIPEFCSYLSSKSGKDDLDFLKQELSEYLEESLKEQKHLIPQTRKRINNQADFYLNHINLQNNLLINKRDNPLHINIRLGEYRFEESYKAFGNWINTANEKGQLPIDVAAELALSYEVGSEQINPGKDPFSVIKHLLSQGAKMTPKVSEVLQKKNVNIIDYHFQSRHYGHKIKNYNELKALVTEIGKDHNLNLKTKKRITLNVIQHHIKKLTSDELIQFKRDLNGSNKKAIAPEFLFISQLRSSLWIVRAIRGLYGNSSSRLELNELINTQRTKRRECFFSSKENNLNKPDMHEDGFSLVTNKKL